MKNGKEIRSKAIIERKKGLYYVSFTTSKGLVPSSNGPWCYLNNARKDADIGLKHMRMTNHAPLNDKELILYKELEKQFGRKDARMFILAPHKYKHHFNNDTLKAYDDAYEGK